MACGCCSGTCGARGLLTHACFIAVVGLAVGAIHSARTPLQLHVDANKLQGTTITLHPPVAAPPTAKVETPASTPSSRATPPPAQVTLGLEVSVAEAFALFQLGTPFIDARHDDEFNQGHVTHAIRMTSDEFLPRAAEVMRFMPGPVVIYCTGGQCDASHNLAKALQQAGFTKLHIMKDGYPAWLAAHPDLAVKP